jgi:hypothetical protein
MAASLNLPGPDGGAGTFDEVHTKTVSPDGRRFVLAMGSGMRRDVIFEVYGEGSEKIAEFPGIRGDLQWIDPVRFVFTRIDGIREGGSFHGLAYGLRLSVAMYDTIAREEIVLKKATDRSNFTLMAANADGDVVSVFEESVAFEEDWSDEGASETKIIDVEIPAAG